MGSWGVESHFSSDFFFFNITYPTPKKSHMKQCEGINGVTMLVLEEKMSESLNRCGQNSVCCPVPSIVVFSSSGQGCIGICYSKM